MAMEETTYAVGSIVWVKVTGGKWWPGEVVAADSCPEEVTKGLKKEPLAIVKYFDEDFYELVKTHGHIQPFGCPRRKDFIKKGRDLLKQDPHLDKFDKDVAEAERLCGTHDLFVLEDLDVSAIGAHGDFPRPEHNHGSALVSSSVPPTPKPSASSVHHVESQLNASESRANSSANVDVMFSTPKDVRIRTQDSTSFPSSGGSFGPYSCDMCSFHTSRIANIIIHQKSHTDLHQHMWPPNRAQSGSSPVQSPKKTSKANSDSKLQKQAPAAMQKIKRKILGSDEKPKRKKTKKEAADEKDKSPPSSAKAMPSGVDGVQQTKAAKKAVEVKEPKKKAPKKKEDDSDAVFEKIKKLGNKRMNRKRGRSYLSMGPSTSPLKSFKRDDGSDESSDEGEFLIMREDINSKEEEPDEEDKFAHEDDEVEPIDKPEREKMDDVVVVDEKTDEPQKIVPDPEEKIVDEPLSSVDKESLKDDILTMNDDDQQSAQVPDEEEEELEGENSVAKSLEEIDVVKDDSLNEIQMMEHFEKSDADQDEDLTGPDKSESEAAELIIDDNQQSESDVSIATAAEAEQVVHSAADVEAVAQIGSETSKDGQLECPVESEVGLEQVAVDTAAEVSLSVDLETTEVEVNGEQRTVKENGLESTKDEDFLQLPAPELNLSSANSDHSYDSSKLLETSSATNNNDDDSVEPMDISDYPASSPRPPPDLPPLPPPLPPTPPPLPPPPPPSPPANDAYSATVIIDPGDIPLPPTKTPEPPPDQAPAIKQDDQHHQMPSLTLQEEPPLEYTKLETLVQPPDMSGIPSDDVYSEELDVEGPTMVVEGNEIIQIGNEQVIDTSMDVFCNEIVIESDDKPGGEVETDGCVEYDDICLMTEDKAKLLENNTVSCDGVAEQQLVVTENGLMQSGQVASSKGFDQAS